MTDRIAKTSELLRAMAEKSTKVVDYLNWYGRRPVWTCPAGNLPTH